MTKRPGDFAGRARDTFATVSGMGASVLPAPNPAGVVWSNLDVSAAMRASRTLVVAAVTTLLILLWVVPMTLIASLTTLESLDLWLKDLDTLSSRGAHVPVVSGFVQGVVPALLLLIFMGLLPNFLTYLSRQQGFISRSEVSFSALNKMFLFQMINVFLVSVVAGSVLDTLKELTSHTDDELEVLGRAIPRTGMFFITLVLLKGESGVWRKWNVDTV